MSSSDNSDLFGLDESSNDDDVPTLDQPPQYIND
jgi:hypothetical protein